MPIRIQWIHQKIPAISCLIGVWHLQIFLVISLSTWFLKKEQFYFIAYGWKIRVLFLVLTIQRVTQFSISLLTISSKYFWFLIFTAPDSMSQKNFIMNKKYSPYFLFVPNGGKKLVYFVCQARTKFNLKLNSMTSPFFPRQYMLLSKWTDAIGIQRPFRTFQLTATAWF